MNSPEQQETTAIVCGHVFRRERPVRLVIRHGDGLWQLVCGEYDHAEDCSDFEPVGLEHLLSGQANLEEIAGLEAGWIAELDDTNVWRSKRDEIESQ